jgi:NADH:ubiquinone oxidoreductase subunit 6 (subunit J)
VVTRANSPVNSLLSLIGIFTLVIVLMIMAKAEFLGYLFLIVYVGAIAILFLFVIMMFNLKKSTTNLLTGE